MNRLLIVRPEAEADIADATVWYENRASGFGLELLSEVKSAIARALENPESFTRVRRNQRFVVFSLDDSPIAFLLLIDRML